MSEQARKHGSATLDERRTPAADVLRVPCATDAVWKAARLVDPAAWQFHLSRSHLDELETALRAVRETGVSLLNLTRERFRLPKLGAELRSVARTLEEGRGFAVIKGLPAGRFDDAEINTIFWGMAQHLGIPVSQDSFGRKLRRFRPGESARFGSPADVELRTGGSDAVALLGPQRGGRTAVVSSAAIYNEVLRRDSRLAERMYGQFRFDRRDEQLPGERPYRSVPLVCWYDGKLSFRYARRDVESAQRFPEVPRLEPADVELLDLIDVLAAEPEFRLEVDVEPGDIQLFNNYAVLHAHVQNGSEVEADPAHQVRRLWLTLHDGRSLPREFIWDTPGFGSPGGRGGVIPRDVIARGCRS